MRGASDALHFTPPLSGRLRLRFNQTDSFRLSAGSRSLSRRADLLPAQNCSARRPARRQTLLSRQFAYSQKLSVCLQLRLSRSPSMR